MVLLLTVPLLALFNAAFLVGLGHLYARRLHTRQKGTRTALLAGLGHAPGSRKLVGFFHPYCNAGGGGERVLWTAVKLFQRDEPGVLSVVYSGDIDATKEQILANVKARFDITLDPAGVHIIFLKQRKWVEDAQWPRFTLAGQSLGSMLLAWEAAAALLPDLFIDTMGYAFSFPVFRLLSSLAGRPVPLGAYVHYPTISTTMIARVASRAAGVTNSSTISRSRFLSAGKLLYYRLFLASYASALRSASFLMVNSSWTRAHVLDVLSYSSSTYQLLSSIVTLAFPPVLLTSFLVRRAYAAIDGRRGERPEVTTVFPPCDTRALAGFKLDSREPIVLSIAQFRPEKEHETQLRAFALLLAQHPEHAASARLVLVGGARNAGDRARVAALEALAASLGIAGAVTLAVNAPYATMLDLLARASAGLSTMVDEHFGIGVVELMAAGVVPVAHASAGPLLDIVVPVDGQPTGVHATSDQGFADGLHAVLSMDAQKASAMRERGRTRAVSAFSEARFEESWGTSGWRAWV